MSTPNQTVINDKATYSISEAAAKLPEVSTSKFVGTASIDVVLKLKEKQKNDSIRGSVSFPNQFGDEKKVLVLAQGPAAEEAEKAGADFVGLEEFVKKIQSGWLEADVIIATPETMPQVAKLGKVLGPKQLMPNPKNGTVTANVENAVKSFKAGKVNFKMDAGFTIKLKFGKLDMTATQLEENLRAAIAAITGEVKKLSGEPIQKVLVKPTMGPSLELELE